MTNNLDSTDVALECFLQILASIFHLLSRKQARLPTANKEMQEGAFYFVSATSAVDVDVDVAAAYSLLQP